VPEFAQGGTQLNMKMAKLFDGAQYVGEAEGDRLSYYVYRTAEVGYLVVSRSSERSFNMNVVDEDAPEAIAKSFKGQRLTTVRLRKSGKRPELFGTSFSCLNALYVMVALRRAQKLKLREGRAIVFKVR
jgi:hypothetical protein